MKKIRGLLLVNAFLGITYFVLDRQLLYYGKHHFDFYHLLPLNIVPEDRPDFEDGFALKDEFGFTIAAKGNTYESLGRKIVINKVLSYCYNTDKVVARIVDENSEEF